MEKQVTHLYIMIGVVFLISGGLFAYNMNQSKTNENNDNTTINALSSFTVTNNQTAKDNYDKLVAYMPKTDKGTKLKAEKIDQKLKEFSTFAK